MANESDEQQFLTLRVTAECIAKGKRGIRSCPIALALRSAFEGLNCEYISVGLAESGGYRIVDDAFEHFRITHSPELTAFIPGRYTWLTWTGVGSCGSVG